MNILSHYPKIATILIVLLILKTKFSRLYSLFLYPKLLIYQICKIDIKKLLLNIVAFIF